jgi:hypothetical protein
MFDLVTTQQMKNMKLWEEEEEEDDNKANTKLRSR